MTFFVVAIAYFAATHYRMTRMRTHLPRTFVSSLNFSRAEKANPERGPYMERPWTRYFLICHRVRCVCVSLKAWLGKIGSERPSIGCVLYYHQCDTVVLSYHPCGTVCCLITRVIRCVSLYPPCDTARFASSPMIAGQMTKQTRRRPRKKPQAVAYSEIQDTSTIRSEKLEKVGPWQRLDVLLLDNAERSTHN